MRPALKLLTPLILLFLLLNFAEYGNLAFIDESLHLFKTTSLAKGLFYVLSYLAIVVSYVVVLLNQSKIAFSVFLAINLIALAVHFTFQGLNGYGLKFFETQLIVNEAKYFDAAVKTFPSHIFEGIAKALAVTLALALPRLIKVRLRPAWLWLVPLSFGFVCLVIIKTSGTRDVYPSAYRLPALMATVVWGTGEQMYYGPRDPVQLKPVTPGAKKIVLIIDESVRADFLTINNDKIPATPYLKSVQADLVNLGVALSVSTCSSDGNTVMRSGLKMNQLPDKGGLALRLPSFFQYAKAAGYKTYNLDGQDKPGRTQNHMSKYDLTSIDEYLYLNTSAQNLPEYWTDLHIAKKLNELLARDEKAFIVVNKAGAHYAYKDRYPDHQAVFQPALLTYTSTPADLDKLIRTYANAVHWSVDEFFKEFFPAIRNSEQTALIYTSDHGISFVGPTDHCIMNSVLDDQTIVPMLLAGDYVEHYFEKGVKELLLNRSSHYFVFPSLLIFMGYPPAEVTQNYGAPLWEGKLQDRTFMAGDLFARGNLFFLNKSRYRPETLPYDFDRVRAMSLEYLSNKTP